MMSDSDDDLHGDPRNRRQFARFSTSISVDYANGDNFLFSYIQNISEMGIFIQSEDPLSVGTRLKLRFAPEGAAALELDGEVVWVNPVKPHGENINPGMGVRFVDLTPDNRERVVELVRTVAYLERNEMAD